MSSHLQSPALENLKETKTINLTVLSPVHIGSKEGKLSALEFLWSNGRTHVIDENLFGGYLLQKKMIDVFVDEVSSGRFKMADFLNGKAKISLKDAAKAFSRLSISGGSDNMREFRPFIRDGNGRLFLPGTSLKGVFRTALLHRILNADTKIKDEIEKKAIENLHRLAGRNAEKNKKSYSEEWLQEDLLESFFLPHGVVGPHEDILRCLTVRDSYPIGDVKSEIVKIQILSRNSGNHFYWSEIKKGPGTGRKIELWVEAITSGTFCVEVLCDSELFNKFSTYNKNRMPVSGLDDLLNMVKEMNERVIDHEKKIYKEAERVSDGANNPAVKGLKEWFDSQNSSLFRLGFGSGMLSTTIDLSFKDDKTRQAIRNACGYNRENDPAPKSRRVFRDRGGKWMPIGWLTIAESTGTISSIENKLQDSPATGMGNHSDNLNPLPKVEDVIIPWSKARLTWDPGKQEIGAQSIEGKKALLNREENILDFIPESLFERLKKKRSVDCFEISVARYGNSFRIIKIIANE